MDRGWGRRPSAEKDGDPCHAIEIVALAGQLCATKPTNAGFRPHALLKNCPYPRLRASRAGRHVCRLQPRRPAHMKVSCSAECWLAPAKGGSRRPFASRGPAYRGIDAARSILGRAMGTIGSSRRSQTGCRLAPLSSAEHLSHHLVAANWPAREPHWRKGQADPSMTGTSCDAAPTRLLSPAETEICVGRPATRYFIG